MDQKDVTFSSDEWKIVKGRIRGMPSHLRLSIGGGGFLDKQQLLEHIDNKDEIGQLLVKMHFNYLRSFKKEASALL